MATHTLYIHCQADNPDRIYFSSFDMSQDPDFGQGTVLLESFELEYDPPENRDAIILETLQRQLSNAERQLDGSILRQRNRLEDALKRFKEKQHDPQMA